MAFSNKNLKAYARATNPRYQTGGTAKKETPEEKLARYIATYGAKGREKFNAEALETAKKTPLPPLTSKRNKKGYEPSDAVENTKAGLAAASLALGDNPIGYLASVAGSTYDAGTAVKHALAGDTNEALEDATQAIIGVIPGFNKMKGAKGEQALSRVKRVLGTLIKGAQTGSDLSNVEGAKFATGGNIVLEGNEGDNSGGRRRRTGRTTAQETTIDPAADSTQQQALLMQPFKPLNDLRPSYTPEVGSTQTPESGYVPTQATNPIDVEVYNWTRDYIDSPKYRERLANFYKYPELVQAGRAKKASNVGFIETKDGGSSYSDNSAFPNQLAISTGQLARLNATRGEVTAHELGHITNAGDFSKVLQLSPREEQLIISKNKTLSPQRRAELSKNAKEQGETLSQYLGQGATHDDAPSENISDIQALRYYLNKKKIYDARTQDLTPKMLEKAKADPEIKKLFSGQRLFKTFDDKDLIEIMNKVAKAETNLNKPETIAAMGGIIKKKYAAGGMAGGGWGAAASALPAVGNLVESLINKPTVYNNQPVMNAQAIHNMSTPYDMPGTKFAFGGEMGDVDDDQYFEWLEQMFDNTEEAEDANEGIDLTADTVELGQDNDEEGWGAEEDEYAAGYEFATGGRVGKSKIYIKPSKRGTFTAAAKKHGKSVQGFARQVLANKSNYSPAMVKKANFARNASKWKHAYGGMAQMVKYAMGGGGYSNNLYPHPNNKFASGGMAPIEVEGEEIVETPDGDMQQMSGPTHEEGGIPMTVPEGTKIYSDRLQIEGKSMQQRKKSRERRIASLDKILEKNPTDALTKATYKRTMEFLDMEDQQDMELQKVANEIYQGNMGKHAMGGVKERKYAVGGETEGGPFDDYYANLFGYAGTQVPYRGLNPQVGTTPISTPTQTPSTALQGKTPTLATTPFNYEPEAPEYKEATGLTTGDYIGLGANVFGAVAPILNTRNAAAARKPNLNRYIGVGREAIESNDLAQGLVGNAKANAMRDLDTSTGTAMQRNRGGARSVNTLRALNTSSDIARNKAQAQINMGANEQLIGLLGQRGQLTNWRDQMQAQGATERDVRDTQDVDNYYSNMAQNLSNFATQAGNIGRNLNINKANKDNTALLESMSEYFDFARDKNGKIVLKKKGS